MNQGKGVFAAIYLATLASAFAQYPGWRHGGAFAIVTTPDGANLPATATETGFPLLVRLDKDWFDFGQAGARGEDLRFAAEGKALAYQIENWDPAAGEAEIWVRIPKIKGNAQQEIRMFWGKAGATSESDGKGVFNDSNGFVAVWHLDDPTKDATGTLEGRDQGTTAAEGVVGNGRRFDVGNGIHCGDNITTFPTGSDPHSTEMWFKAGKSGDRIACWGSGGPKAMVQMILGKPPQMNMDCYGAGAGMRGKSAVPMAEWVHVMHTCGNGEARLYLNGQLDAESTGNGPPLEIKRPAKMYIGGWENFSFSGDIDEVRVSKVPRSADWVKLQYENQKPLQTLVGPLMRPWSEFSLSVKSIALSEGESTTVTAKAGGARKLRWVIKRGDKESVAAADRFSFTLDAGRVTQDEAFALRLEAVFADGMKSLEIPVTVKEDLPDPEFTLQAPAAWNGRDAVEVVPRIANLAALRAKGVDTLDYRWEVSGLAVNREIVPGKLVLKRSQNSGPLTVTATADNGGAPVTRSIRIDVKEPAEDTWTRRVPEKDEKPVDNQFYARDDTNEGTLYYNGTLDAPADPVFLKLYADNRLIKTESQKPGADGSYSFAVKLKAGKVVYKVEFGTGSGNRAKVLETFGNLVCGDAYIIQGQSNAVGYNYENTDKRHDLTRTNSPWIRSFGGNGEVDGDPLAGGWGNAVVERLTPSSPDRIHFISAWGMAMAKKLVDDTGIPVCILNGAVGGTRIDEHMPDHVRNAGQGNRERPIYTNLRKRVEAARLTHGIRAVLWHQGEADQGFDGPDNCYGCEMYERYWLELTSAWKQDYPNIRDYYVFQIWPNACSQGGTRNSDKLRDVQRRLSRLYSSLTVMPTLDIPSGASCHFKTDDYEKMGLAMAPLLERDIHGKVFDQPVSAADIGKAYYTTAAKDEIALEFDQPVAWFDGLAGQFHLDGEAGKVASGSVAGNVIKLKLASPSTAGTITYVVDRKWDPQALLFGKNGIAALTFCEVPLGIAKPGR